MEGGWWMERSMYSVSERKKLYKNSFFVVSGVAKYIKKLSFFVNMYKKWENGVWDCAERRWSIFIENFSFQELARVLIREILAAL